MDIRNSIGGFVYNRQHIKLDLTGEQGEVKQEMPLPKAVKQVNVSREGKVSELLCCQEYLKKLQRDFYERSVNEPPMNQDPKRSYEQFARDFKKSAKTNE